MRVVDVWGRSADGGRSILSARRDLPIRGEFTKAEAAYARANGRGRKPYPGLALLRLAQGQIDAAAVSIRGVLARYASAGSSRQGIAAAIEILLAARDLDTASAATGELPEIANRIGASLLRAASAHATGALLLARGTSLERQRRCARHARSGAS